jgi:hypothetical protein
LRREIEPSGVGAAHDQRQGVKGRRLQAELLEHHVECAQFAAMGPEHAVNVERRAAVALGDLLNLRLRHEQDHGVRVDKATDQPRAGDAIDFGACARDPDRPPGGVARGQVVGLHQEAAAVAPGFEAAVQIFGVDALRA